MKTNRRKFIQTSITSSVGISLVPRYVLGKGWVPPSDQILIGIIGCGMQGRGLQNALCNYPQVRLVSASDVNLNKLNLLAENTIKKYSEVQPTWGVKKIDTFQNYSEQLNQKELDAMVISTPDHWHAKQSLETMELGLDIFCEKPISHTINEGQQIVESAKINKIVFQTGSMQRSWNHFRNVSELIRNGYLGEIKKIVVHVGDPSRPCDLPPEPLPENLDWDGWLGPAPLRPYNSILSPPVDERVFPRWRWFDEFGGGIVADWGAHMFDIVQWALGTDHTGPIKIIPPKNPNAKRGLRLYYSSGIEMIHDNRKLDTDQHGIEFFGSEGKMTVARGYIKTEPENIANAKIKDSEIKLYKSDDHLLNWIESIRSRKKVITNAEIGHRTATICQLVNIGYKLGRDLDWDPERERFKGNAMANKLRRKKYRKPHKI
ncbi:MAG: Gfo/Idh/MocA family oxidoreductase [Flavobacteriaceae bacterium]|nr:Gfo/Idh/MocA family oxidoreductase [Flavobacteriaceae bacterium]